MILTHLNRHGRMVRTLNRKTNQVIVTETRYPKPFRALPRQVIDRIGSLEVSQKFRVRYQDLMGLYVAAVRCWKCGVPIVSRQPALRPVEGQPNAGEFVTAHLNGKEMVLGDMLPFSHYREGEFEYRLPGRTITPPPAFSYLHCADCEIKPEHGEDLLACLLGQFDSRRDALKPYMAVMSDDAWAQFMFGWSGIELVGTMGPSLSPADLMKRKD